MHFPAGCKPRDCETPVFSGISYFSFKLVHFLVDCYNRKIRQLDFLTFTNYVCFFPGFFAGPINRYSAFAEDILNSPPADYRTGGKRIINGLFKKTVAGIIQPFAITALNLSQSHPSSKLVLSVYAYMFFIYFDFSGYSDLAIGSARMMGVKLPENFNNPFLKRNLQQFWANWHMSLTTWLTDYIYWPLARKFRHARLLAKSPVTTSNICIILTFMVCGLWHRGRSQLFSLGDLPRTWACGAELLQSARESTHINGCKEVPEHFADCSSCQRFHNLPVCGRGISYVRLRYEPDQAFC